MVAAGRERPCVRYRRIRSLNEIRAPLQGANDLWVGIMFQGDFLTKITLRFHRSHLWCEGNLYHGPKGANGDSEGSRRDPGRE